MNKHAKSNEPKPNEPTMNNVNAEANCDPEADAASPAACMDHQGRAEYFMDIDRMVNEGLGGGNVTYSNGLIEETTTDTMNDPESIIDNESETTNE
ncbi:hypothetical protein [Paenibacillus agricola]|uniref:DUF4025 domain-containing protein n=1 Tax=Paenibacillus agricola TaxID=2716264 RepID=A0ABX0JCL7_9BACL|nr:hypothetical protein [Paenibacillus agricola]NHN31959.1 hypothetical protein [Paenibacillus agricola]